MCAVPQIDHPELHTAVKVAEGLRESIVKKRAVIVHVQRIMRGHKARLVRARARARRCCCVLLVWPRARVTCFLLARVTRCMRARR